MLEAIRGGWDEAPDVRWSESLERTLRNHLSNDPLATSAPEADDLVVGQFRENFPGTPDAQWRPSLETRLASLEGLDSFDAERIADSAFLRCREALRAAQVDLFMTALSDTVPEPVRDNVNFRRKAGGVLWEMVNDRPVFLASSCAGIEGLDRGVVERVPVKIDQTGAPGVFRSFDKLLYRSQVQSLLLATCVVFLLVAITQKSIRRGVISIVAVLVPLAIVIGLMGWMGIPLDFGTALCGALIIGLGIDGCIHVLHYEASLNGRGLSEEESIVVTLRHVGRAVLTANITTAGGFAMLIFSVIKASRNFAIVNVLAIVMVSLSILTLLPVLIRLAHAAGPGRRRSSKPEVGG